MHASGYWIRLLDGDDNVTYKSTSKMLYLAHRYKVNFVYGLISEKSQILTQCLSIMLNKAEMKG